MITINLEKELLKQNKKIVTPKELLLINEFEKVSAIIDDDSLKRIGVIGAGQKGSEIKNKINRLKGETERFDQSRVFHISQIEKLCNKYYLKFLPSCMFNGEIDNQLPFKIANFEAAYDVKCYSEKGYYTSNSGNTFIAAPQESFDLQEKPKDPLLFFKINSEYYYLIYKWGNDLSVTRAIKGLLSSGKTSILITLSMLAMFITCFSVAPNVIALIFMMASGLAFLFHLVGCAVYEKWLSYYPENNFMSPFKED